MRQGTVLCLDVDPAVAEAITRPVVDAGYAVVRETRANAAGHVEQASVILADLRPDGPPLPAFDRGLVVALVGKDTPEPRGAVEVLVDPRDADTVLAAVDRALARHRLISITEALQAPLRSLAEAVREAQAAFDEAGASAAQPHLERIQQALGDLEAKVGVLADEADEDR